MAGGLFRVAGRLQGAAQQVLALCEQRAQPQLFTLVQRAVQRVAGFRVILCGDQRLCEINRAVHGEVFQPECIRVAGEAVERVGGRCRAGFKVPKGVICLLSALRFHKFTTQSPHEVWMAIGVKAWAPRTTSPAIRFVRMSGKALHSGMKEYPVRGESLKVYTPAKTVADCFKFRNKIGLDVAMEALKECYHLKKATMDEVWAAAKICRVAKVMRPYMESL
jgi:hypothetical protein